MKLIVFINAIIVVSLLIGCSQITTVNFRTGLPAPACNADPGSPPSPIMRFHAGKTYEANTILANKIKPVTEYFMKASGRYLATGSDNERKAIVDTLLKWSEVEAMTDWGNWEATVDSSWSTYYHAMAAIFPMVRSYGLVRKDMDLDQIMQVDAWLGGLIDRVNIDAVGSGGRFMGMWYYAGRQDNKYYQLQAINMAWGSIQGDNNMFDGGLKAFQGAISALRADGSIRKESGRGGSAIHYSNTAIMNLISIAEQARAKGVNLYSASYQERTIHTAITFLLDAIEDPRLIVEYAKRDTGSSFKRDSIYNQNLRFLSRHYSGEAGFAWAKIYSARFPHSDITSRLQLAAPWLKKDEPVFHYLSGMNTSCVVSLEGQSSKN